MNQANEDCQKFAKEKEEDLRKFAIKLAEILIKKQLDVDASTITNILAPVFIELEKPDEMIIVRANALLQAAVDRSVGQNAQRSSESALFGVGR